MTSKPTKLPHDLHGPLKGSSSLRIGSGHFCCWPGRCESPTCSSGVDVCNFPPIRTIDSCQILGPTTKTSSWYRKTRFNPLMSTFKVLRTITTLTLLFTFPRLGSRDQSACLLNARFECGKCLSVLAFTQNHDVFRLLRLHFLVITSGFPRTKGSSGERTSITMFECT